MLVSLKDHEVDLAVLQTAVLVPFALQAVNLSRAIYTEHRDTCSTGRDVTEKLQPITPATVSRKYQPSFYELAGAGSHESISH